MAKSKQNLDLFKGIEACGRPVDARKSQMRIDPRSGARLLVPHRNQVVLLPLELEQAIPPDHVMRAIWKIVGSMNTDKLYARVGSRAGSAGAPAIDPRLMLALWVAGVGAGINSARELARRCKQDLAFLWLCGGVTVHHRCLSIFRRANGDFFLSAMTDVLAPLMHEGLIDLGRVAQDGMRVRADAGAASFRRGETLEQLRAQARTHLAEVLAEPAAPGGARRRAARERGARQRVDRIEKAVEELPKVAETKRRNGSKQAPRVSTTDPEARVMKMGDGGFRPAFNVQFATTTDEARVVVGVDVTNRGTDSDQMPPMVSQIRERTGRQPDEMLVDGGFTAHDAIDTVAANGIKVFGPVPKPRKHSVCDEHEPKSGDSPAVAEWRERMGTEEAKATYKQRCATAETTNADTRCNRALDDIPLRGLAGALTCAALSGLAYNVMRIIALST